MNDHIVLLQAPGGIDQFRIEDQPVSEPGSGEVRIRHQAIGTNFLDIYHREGIYPLPSYPAVIGAEAAGIVEAVGADVADFRPGDRVAYAGPPVGAYCSVRNIAAEKVIKLPDTVSTRMAATSLLKGMTAHMLLEKVYPVRKGSSVLIHAAAGGLGSMLVRWAKSLDATVIGTASSADKALRAAAYGADHLIVGREADLVGEVRRITGGAGVDVAYDGIGGSMLVKSIRAAGPFGSVVTIGQVAGPVPPVAVEDLRPGKSLRHASVMAWCSDLGRYRESAHAAIRAMEAGIVSEIAGEFPLEDVDKAHAQMEAGQAAGTILLKP